MSKVYTATLRTKEINDVLTDYVLQKRGNKSGNFRTRMVTTSSEDEVVIKLVIREVKGKHPKAAHSTTSKGEL